MALSPSVAWLAAAERSPNEPRVLLEITDGATTWRAIDGYCGHSDFEYTDVGLIRFSPLGEEVDPFTRKTQIGSIIIDVADPWIRPIATTNRLFGQQVSLLLGFKDLAEADFINVFLGSLGDPRPMPGGNVVELDAADAFMILRLHKIVGYWTGMHPLEIAEDIIDKSGVLAAFKDTASMDPTQYGGTMSHWNCSRGGGSRQDFDDFVIREPVSAHDLLDEIALMLNGMWVRNEAGQIKFIEFDNSASAVDHWDEDIIQDFDQLETTENLVNDITASIVRDKDKEYIQNYNQSDDDSQSNYAFPGTAKRIISEVLECPWLDHTSAWLNPLANGVLAMTLRGSSVHGFTGCRWPNYGVDGQPATATLAGGRAAYFLIVDEIPGGANRSEIVKCTAAVPANETEFETRDPSTDGIVTHGPYPAEVTYTIVRGQLGTADLDHAGGYAGMVNPVKPIFDITIPVAMVTARLARFGSGAPRAEVTVPISKAWLQYGDLVTLNHSRYLDYGHDGLVSGDGKWEVTLKELSLYDGEPHMRFVLTFAGTSSPATTHNNTRGSAVGIGTGLIEAIAGEDVAGPFATTGLVVTQTAGLVGEVSAGTMATGAVRTSLLVDLAHTFTASKDTYVAIDQLDGGVRFYETALAAGRPTYSPTERELAKVTTGAVAITAIDTTEKPTTAIDGIKLHDLSVDTEQIAALAVETAKIDALAVTTAKVDNLNITAAKLAANSVETAKIKALNVTRAKILTIGFSAFLDSGEGGNQPVGSGAWVKVKFDSEDYDENAEYDNDVEYECYIATAGKREFTASVKLLAIANGSFAQLALFKNDAVSRYGPKTYNHTGGADDLFIPGPFGSVAVVGDDVFDVRIWHNHGVNRDVDSAANSSLTWFTGKQVI